MHVHYPNCLQFKAYVLWCCCWQLWKSLNVGYTVHAEELKWHEWRCCRQQSVNIKMNNGLTWRWMVSCIPGADYTHWLRGWAGPRGSMNFLEERKSLAPVRNQTLIHDIQPIAYHYKKWTIQILKSENVVQLYIKQQWTCKWSKRVVIKFSLVVFPFNSASWRNAGGRHRCTSLSLILKRLESYSERNYCTNTDLIQTPCSYYPESNRMRIWLAGLVSELQWQHGKPPSWKEEYPHCCF